MKNLDKAAPHLKAAAANLLRCWDEMRAAEKELDIEITFDDMEAWCGGMSTPEDALEMEDSEVAEFLKEIVAGEPDEDDEEDNPSDSSPEADPEGGCHCGINCDRGPHEACPFPNGKPTT